MVITLPVLLTCVSILFIIWGSTTFALGFFWGKNTILENTETFSENTHVQGKIGSRKFDERKSISGMKLRGRILVWCGKEERSETEDSSAIVQLIKTAIVAVVRLLVGGGPRMLPG
jgi:hypothetical protein